ncbi:MAG: uracil-DNA glycosylase [Clostridia bacterium]|nr:uracil-DNA glycosylase [Clostridia bacterium]
MTLGQLEAECLDCNKCALRAGAKQVIFGEGSPDARLMFVGEGPGRHEDDLGKPFVGAAGVLLDKIFKASGLKREEVYITNVVKCRPPGNRMPTAKEIRACGDYLKGQIQLVKPSIIVCLGALATKTLINPQARITRIRGEWFERNGIKILPTFHPAALLRDPGKKRPVWEDFKELVRVYRDISVEQMDLKW